MVSEYRMVGGALGSGTPRTRCTGWLQKVSHYQMIQKS